MSIATRTGVQRAYPMAAATSQHVNAVAELAAGLANRREETELVEAGDIVAADVGTTAYFVDDSTVSKSHDTNSRPIAGKIIQVDDDGVWVELGV